MGGNSLRPKPIEIVICNPDGQDTIHWHPLDKTVEQWTESCTHTTKKSSEKGRHTFQYKISNTES